MQQHIIKSFAILGIFILSLFVLSQKAAAQITSDVSLSSPDMAGRVISNTSAGISGVWVRWQDNQGNVRFTQTRSDGSYLFYSWQNLGDQGREDQYNTMIDTNLDGTVDSRMANITQNSGFGCVENPHTITVVKPYNWAGSFSTATFGDISNDPASLQFPEIIYTPGANSASCISIDAPSQITAGQQFTATVRMKNNTIPSQWTAQNNYRLGRWDNPNNGWVFPDGNQDRVYLQSPVNGGDTYTFSNFNITAPNTSGTKSLEVRMVQDGREWFGEICSKPITVNAVPATSPSIQGININNGGGTGSAVRTSGLSSDQGGTGYNNPLTITLNATAGKNGDGTDVAATYYVIFYNKSTGIITSDVLNSATNRLADPKNGFILVYDQTNNRCGGSHCVFDPVKNSWVNISDLGVFGYRVLDSSNNLLYVVAPGNDSNNAAEREWRLNFDKNFGSKGMYTAAYVFDKNNQSAYTPGGDITPTTQ